MAEVRARLSSEYNALPFPPDELRGRKVLTYNLEKLLVRSDGRPAVFNVQLDDVARRGAACVIHLTAFLDEEDITDERMIHLHLRTRCDQIRSLIESPSVRSPLEESLRGLLRDGEYAIVARISNVTRAMNDTGDAQHGDDATGTDEAELESPATFAATGELLAIEPYAGETERTKGTAAPLPTGMP